MYSTTIPHTKPSTKTSDAKMKRTTSLSYWAHCPQGWSQQTEATLGILWAQILGSAPRLCHGWGGVHLDEQDFLRESRGTGILTDDLCAKLCPKHKAQRTGRGWWVSESLELWRREARVRWWRGTSVHLRHSDPLGNARGWHWRFINRGDFWNIFYQKCGEWIYRNETWLWEST